MEYNPYMGTKGGRGSDPCHPYVDPPMECELFFKGSHSRMMFFHELLSPWKFLKNAGWNEKSRDSTFWSAVEWLVMEEIM